MTLKKIGWKELVGFPEFGLIDVPAKIDTGARTSVIHCKKIEVFKRYRRNFVRFTPLSEEFFPGLPEQEFIFPFHKERKVKNSFGQEENRIVILTKLELYNKQYPIEISLRDRSNMEFPMLLGRSFIRKKFLVDVSRSNLSYKYKQKKIKSQLS